MSEIVTYDFSKSKELNQSDNRKQVNIKKEPQEETANHESSEGIIDTKLLNTATETEYNNEVYKKEELKIKYEETEEQVVTNYKVTGAYATDVIDGVHIKCEHLDITENVYDQKLVVENDGVTMIKPEVVKSRIACEFKKGVHRGMVTVPGKELLEDVCLNNNIECCYKELTDNASATESNQNVIHHIPIKKETLFAHKNIFGSTSIDGNIGENLKAVDPGKTSCSVNTRKSEALPHCKELRVVLEDIMLPSSKHNTQDSLMQLTAQSLKDNRTICHPTTKNKNMFMDPKKMSNMDTEIPKKLFTCDICEKKFNINSNLMQHIREHPEMYRCTYCSYKTCYKKYLKDHINCVHTKKIVFICDYCGYESYFKYHLKSHINNKHSNRVSYNCDYCSYKSYREAKLSDHINSEHTKSTVFTCSYCSFKTYRKNKLKNHTEILHTKTNVYTCSRCNYKTCEKWNYNRHVNAKHTKTNVYNCSLCTYKSYYKITLTKHINVKHTKTNVYNCPHCDYKTYDDHSLRTHVNVKHTKKSVYNCSHCVYKAYDKSTLNKHVKAKHTKTVFNCCYCAFETHYQSCLTRHIKLLHSCTK